MIALGSYMCTVTYDHSSVHAMVAVHLARGCVNYWPHYGQRLQHVGDFLKVVT